MSRKLNVEINLNELFKSVALTTIDSIILSNPEETTFDTPQEVGIYFSKQLNLALSDFNEDYKVNLEASLAREITQQLINQSKYFD